jgi:hypothetical protein
METSKNSTRQLTLDELISSQEGSPANPTHSQERERERKTNATCGPRCCALFENAPLATSWAKTFAALLVGMEGWYSRRCALTWKLVGTPYNRSYFQLAVSVLPTEETASGLLPTPTTDERDTKYAQGGTNLRPAVKMLPTPRARAEGGNCSKDRGKRNLEDVISTMLPTPTTRDYKGARSQQALDKAGRDETNSLPDAFAQSGKTSQLSPLFVEEMMGFPKNWTASPFQSGDENP